jgi:hypothetical protein
MHIFNIINYFISFNYCLIMSRKCSYVMLMEHPDLIGVHGYRADMH